MVRTSSLSFLALLLFVTAGIAQDAPDVITRARSAELVVVGTVDRVVPMAIQNEYGDQLIISRTTVVVEEALQGSPTETLTVDIEGGTLGDLTLEVSDMPSVKQGDRGVFIVTRGAGNSHVLHLRARGCSDYVRTKLSTVQA